MPGKENEPKVTREMFQVTKVGRTQVEVARSAAQLALKWHEPGDETERARIIRKEKKAGNEVQGFKTRQGRSRLVIPGIEVVRDGEKIKIDGETPVYDFPIGGSSEAFPATELLSSGDLIAIDDDNNGNLTVHLILRAPEE